MATSRRGAGRWVEYEMNRLYVSPGSRRGTAVVVGCGRVGSSITIALYERGHTIRVLDPDDTAFDRLPLGAVDDGDVIPIVGDGTLESDLRRASAQDADVFIAACGSDSRNVMAAQIAQHILAVPKVICRVDDPALEEMYSSLGLFTINVTGMITEMILEGVSEVLDMY